MTAIDEGMLAEARAFNEQLERRLASMKQLARYADLPGAGAAGGLGAALAALGAELVPGAVEQPGEVERRVADPGVAPVDHAGEPPRFVDQQMRRPEIRD